MDNDDRDWAELIRQVLERTENGLDALAWMDKPFSEDLSLAIGELDSRSIRLRGAVFERWLVVWHELKGETPNAATPNALSICFEPKIVAMTRFLEKKEGKGATPIKAAELYTAVCNPSDGRFDTAKNRMLRDDAPAMGRLDVWRYEVVLGLVKGSTGHRPEPRGYRFWPGPALLAFKELVFDPLRLRQVAAFVAAHGNRLNQSNPNADDPGKEAA